MKPTHVMSKFASYDARHLIEPARLLLDDDERTLPPEACAPEGSNGACCTIWGCQPHPPALLPSPLLNPNTWSHWPPVTLAPRDRGLPARTPTSLPACHFSDFLARLYQITRHSWLERGFQQIGLSRNMPRRFVSSIQPFAKPVQERKISQITWRVSLRSRS